MTFKEDLEKLVKDAKPGRSLFIAIVDSEAARKEFEEAGFDLAVVGKQFVRK